MAGITCFEHAGRVLASAALLLLLACKPSTEGETKSYERNKIELTDLSEQWPGFKSVADAKLAAVEPAWTAARDVPGQDERAAAMKAANEQFDPLLNKLSQVDAKADNLSSRVGKLRSIRLNTRKNRTRREVVIEDANMVLDEVDQAMSGASPADEAAAVALLDEQISKLIRATSPVDSMINKFKTKIRPRKKKK